MSFSRWILARWSVIGSFWGVLDGPDSLKSGTGGLSGVAAGNSISFSLPLPLSFERGVWVWVSEPGSTSGSGDIEKDKKSRFVPHPVSFPSPSSSSEVSAEGDAVYTVSLRSLTGEERRGW